MSQTDIPTHCAEFPLLNTYILGKPSLTTVVDFTPDRDLQMINKSFLGRGLGVVLGQGGQLKKNRLVSNQCSDPEDTVFLYPRTPL